MLNVQQFQIVNGRATSGDHGVRNLAAGVCTTRVPAQRQLFQEKTALGQHQQALAGVNHQVAGVFQDLIRAHAQAILLV